MLGSVSKSTDLTGATEASHDELSQTTLWLGGLPISWTPPSTLGQFKHRAAGSDTIKTLLDLEVLNFHKGNHVMQNDRRTCIVFLTWATHQEKKKTHMHTHRWQVLLEMNASHCAGTGQAEMKVHGSLRERNWIDAFRQRTRYYFAVVILVLLPRSGSLANLF